VRDGDVSVAALILAGHASRPLPLDRPRAIVAGDALELGRDGLSELSSADLEDPLMSRRHARINRLPDGEFVVSDLGSTNGTWLEGRRVPPGIAVRLRVGATLMMGGHVFVFRRVTREELEAIREDWACPFGPVPTLSARMAMMMRKLSRIAPAAVDVLLAGETGVGKEAHAEAIHKTSGRKGPFVAINCAAIPDNLVESELFGYARGAHSTADRGKPGLFEQAQGGTLFLDEIGEMSPHAQAKLLRFLQSRELLTLGTTRPRRLDVRVVAATNRPLGPSASDTGGLRSDLLARLGPEPLTLPPLRDRGEDIGILAGFFAKGSITFAPEAYQSLFLHDWKGNVRELQKVVTLARILAGEGVAVGIEHLPAPVAARIDTAPVKTPVARHRPSREELQALLSAHAGDVPRIAREIGRQRTLVWRWLRESQLRPESFRS
jgi:transcriptional regulator with PAS, ATPase and Fis domain